MSTLACECPREPREISGRGFVPALAVRIATVDMDEESRERTHVLVVVAYDVDERPGFAESQVVEVAAGDLPAGHVAVAP